MRLGGRAAEVLVLGEASTGASNDLAGATQLATAHGPGLGHVRAGRARSASPRDGPDYLGEGGFIQAGPTPRTRSGPSTRRWPACCAKPKPGPPSCSRPTGRSSIWWWISCLEKETIDGKDLLAIVNAAAPAGAPVRQAVPAAVHASGLKDRPA